ncbi:uncharacterized protein MELLADRAFT_94157 [Melampsora larici-populina 98AG31]|uniref:Uncharacterized protein n=1 Tax=Melampsora larici-populina (strain 98AG31 / pathotype 3-4-7) TaxID=747676 RepID=F4S6P3_MELLP|nr:uncharacterized protein MELLADRAFT_94157 [Melampsora larici-populina 98AG31]EGF99724.1 hypothetical protein MELLADRAFT_94157 [Melampsora larici-populina 98AG31]
MMQGNFFESPFGPSQGAGDGTSGNGLSLFGLNNHSALMNGRASAFEDPPRGTSDANASRRSSNLGGANFHDVNTSLAFSAGRARNNRSVSPRGRSNTMSTDHRGSINSQPGSLGLGQGNGFEGHTQSDSVTYTCALPAQTLKVFEAWSKDAGLDMVWHEHAKQQAEIFGDANRHIAQAIAQARIMMEVSALHTQISTLTEHIATMSQIVKVLAEAPASVPNKRTSTPTSDDEGEWAASPQLLDVMNPLALRLLMSPALDAYTALKNKQEGIIPTSLFNGIKLTIAKESAAFTAKHLPAVHQGVEEASAAKKYCSAIKDSAKHAREKLHNVILTGIHDPKMGEEVEIAVPNIRSLVQKVAIRCGTASPTALVDAVWGVTDLPTRARIAYLGGRGSESIWACVDKQLSRLRLRNDDAYAVAFYQIVFDKDCKHFTGETYFQVLKENKINLNLPSEEAVLAPPGSQRPESSQRGLGRLPLRRVGVWQAPAQRASCRPPFNADGYSCSRLVSTTALSAPAPGPAPVRKVGCWNPNFIAGFIVNIAGSLPSRSSNTHTCW